MLNSVVQVDDLVVSRGENEILHGVSMSLERGSITGLLGPSGCGKTTLMRTIMGVQNIVSGSVTILGKPAGSAELRKRVAFTSQALSIYRDITVLDNALYFARLIGASKDDAVRACEQVQLGDYLDRPVANLSGGQANRASLACALVGSPEILVLDEPTVGLDPLTREGLWEVFHSLADTGVTLLISSHVMDEATRCDSALIMRDGHFLAHEPISSVMDRTGAADPEDAFLRLIKEIR